MLGYLECLQILRCLNLNGWEGKEKKGTRIKNYYLITANLMNLIRFLPLVSTLAAVQQSLRKAMLAVRWWKGGNSGWEAAFLRASLFLIKWNGRELGILFRRIVSTLCD